MRPKSFMKAWAGSAMSSFTGIVCRCDGGPDFHVPAMMIDSSANRPAAEHGNTPQPKRVLGFRDLVMFYVVATLSLRWIAVAASAGPSTMVIWLIGLATIFIPLALCVLELSSRYPQEGGMYVWSK